MSTTVQYDVSALLEMDGNRPRGNRHDCRRCGGLRTIAHMDDVFFCHKCKWKGNAVTLARDLGLYRRLASVACIYAVRIQPFIRAKWASHEIALACLVGLLAVVAGTMTVLTEQLRAAVPLFLGLSLFVVGISGIALILFPDIVPFSLSLWDAASSSRSQQFVLIGAAFVTPVVLGYNTFAYWIFRGKTPERGWGE